MSSQDAELSTIDGLQPPSTYAPYGAFGAARVPALTIAWHPTLERVGDRALLSMSPGGSPIPLSRLEPDFSPPGSATGEPLGDPHVSRKPIHLLKLENDYIRIDTQGSSTRVVANGTPLEGSRDFSPLDLEAGIVLELANRVVLLLHLDELRQETGEDLGLVGASHGIERVRREIRRLASLDVPVLIRGETGTGKELVAQALHNAGVRRNRPFVAVNMGAIPAALAAAELFGSDRGAFTGAVRSHAGYFGAAEDGTLFLDEVGEIPLDVQASLLRALDVGEVQPLGAARVRETNARIVAATDADLEVKVQSGMFRGPLLHRLASYELVLPPLRQRRDDIGRLFLHFLRVELERFGKTDRIGDHGGKVLPTSFIAALVRHDWPGNVRQLRNVVRQIVLGSHDAGPLDPGPALASLMSSSPTPPGGGAGGQGESSASAAKEPPISLRRKPSEVSEEELLEALRVCDFDVKATAERLGISRTSLYALVEDNPKVRRASDLDREEILRVLRECDGNVELTARRLEVSKVALQRRISELKIA
ncbi:sigma 54-interacting transcriptional regulator [Polyangium spumosum]|uniref:sigma 54-interacting transcriptional regulator n=1 Tax=Polyangium spumosum TaxID=889282 RepID=UPI003083F55D